MRKLITTLVFLVLGSAAMAQNNGVGSPSSSNPRGNVSQAPVGHRQPRLADVPRHESVSAWEAQQHQTEEELDRKLIICKGC